MSIDSFGVFLGGQKIAEYDQLVERIGRADIEHGVVFVDGPIKRPIPRGGKIALAAVFTAPVWGYMLACAIEGCR